MNREVGWIAGVVVGLPIFVVWLKLVGPQIHVVEPVIGLVLGVVAGSGVWWRLCRKSECNGAI